MLIRSSILASVALVALAGFAQGQMGDMGGSQVTPAPQTPTNTLPAPTTAPKPGASLNDVQNPRATLMGAKVHNSKGEAIGEVKSVQLGADGKVAAVNVDVGGKTVALKADTLTYAQLNNTLISTQTKAEISQ